MKKIVAMMLAMVLVMSIASIAMADKATFDPTAGTVTVKKTFTLTDATNHPADSIAFTVAWVGAEDTPVGFDESVWSAEAKLPTVAAVTVAEDEQDDDIVITLPTYTTYGIFEYSVTETAGSVAGVTYNTAPFYIRVGVAKKDNATSETDVEVKYVAVRNAPGGEGEKTNQHQNTYGAGQLTVSKTVSGTQADINKVWHFEVEFTPASNKTVRSTIHAAGTNDGVYSETAAISDDNAGSPSGDIVPGTSGWDRPKTIYVALKHGDSMVFTGIPDGVTYTVTETEADQDGYTTTETPSDSTKTIASGDKDTYAFENKKDLIIDTGIELDAVPYMIIMAIALMGVAMMFVRRKEEM